MKVNSQTSECIARRISLLQIVFVLVLASTALSSCRSRADAARDAAARAPVESTSPLDPPVIDSKNLEIRDENDPPFAKEIKQSYELSKGAKVKVQQYSGRLEVRPSESNEAQVYLVRLSNDKQQFRRKVMIDHSPEELTIRTEREERSAMFEIFSANRSDRQRAIIMIPQGTNLEINEASGRIRVENIDGKISLHGVYGPVEVAGISNAVSVRTAHGRIGLSVKSLAKEGISVVDINGTIDIAVAEPINAEVHAIDINGRIDVDVPNLVTQGEKEFGRFNGKIGKGGPSIEVRDVNGRVRVQTLARAQAAGASSPTPMPQMKMKVERELKVH
jgi:putative adhesin